MRSFGIILIVGKFENKRLRNIKQSKSSSNRRRSQSFSCDPLARNIFASKRRQLTSKDINVTLT